MGRTQRNIMQRRTLKDVHSEARRKAKKTLPQTSKQQKSRTAVIYKGLKRKRKLNI